MVIGACAASAGAHAGLVPEHLREAPALGISTGIPILQPRPEPVDVVGLVTKLAEALGLACALSLNHPVGGRRPSALQEVSR